MTDHNSSSPNSSRTSASVRGIPGGHLVLARDVGPHRGRYTTRTSSTFPRSSWTATANPHHVPDRCHHKPPRMSRTRSADGGAQLVALYRIPDRHGHLHHVRCCLGFVEYRFAHARCHQSSWLDLRSSDRLIQRTHPYPGAFAFDIVNVIGTPQRLAGQAWEENRWNKVGSRGLVSRL